MMKCHCSFKDQSYSLWMISALLLSFPGAYLLRNSIREVFFVKSSLYQLNNLDNSALSGVIILFLLGSERKFFAAAVN